MSNAVEIVASNETVLNLLKVLNMSNAVEIVASNKTVFMDYDCRILFAGQFRKDLAGKYGVVV